MYFYYEKLKFRDKIIDNKAFQQTGVFIKSVEEPVSPGFYYTSTPITYRDKTIYTAKGLSDKLITVVLGIKATTKQQRMQKINSTLNTLVGGEGELILYNDENYHYKASLLDEIQQTIEGNYTYLTLKFLASALKYANEETVIEIASGTASKIITYTSDYKAVPKIILNGSGNINVNFGGYSFSQELNSETITIDSDNLVVYDNNNNNKISNFSGDFPIIHLGDNLITLEGNSNIKMTLKFREVKFFGGVNNA